MNRIIMNLSSYVAYQSFRKPWDVCALVAHVILAVHTVQVGSTRGRVQSTVYSSS